MIFGNKENKVVILKQNLIKTPVSYEWCVI